MKFGPFIAALVLTLLICACSHRVQLPRYDHVPDFQMTDSEGRAFSSASLQGKVWVADFIYTNCPAECPLMSAKMHTFSKRVDPHVRLISFSVDPARDTPAVLHTFASHFGGPTPQWTFLTGSPGTVHLLAYNTFHVGDIISKMNHSTKFVLVDQQRYIRGYYSSFSTDSIRDLKRDADALQQQ